MDSVEGYDVALPKHGSRLMLLAIVCMAGSTAAYFFSPVVSWNSGIAVVLILPLLAGLSTLWSP